jgi:hypothetical protein
MNEHALCAFAEVIGEGDQTALLFDHHGVVRAGMYLDSPATTSAEKSAPH